MPSNLSKVYVQIRAVLPDFDHPRPHTSSRTPLLSNKPLQTPLCHPQEGTPLSHPYHIFRASRIPVRLTDTFEVHCGDGERGFYIRWSFLTASSYHPSIQQRIVMQLRKIELAGMPPVSRHPAHGSQPPTAHEPALASTHSRVPSTPTHGPRLVRPSTCSRYETRFCTLYDTFKPSYVHPASSEHPTGKMVGSFARRTRHGSMISV